MSFKKFWCLKETEIGSDMRAETKTPGGGGRKDQMRIAGWGDGGEDKIREHRERESSVQMVEQLCQTVQTV